MVLPPDNDYRGKCEFCREYKKCANIYILPKGFTLKITKILLCKKCLFELGKYDYVYIFEENEKNKVNNKNNLKSKIQGLLKKLTNMFKKKVYDESDDESEENIAVPSKKFQTNSLGSLKKFQEEDLNTEIDIGKNSSAFEKEEYKPKIHKARRSSIYGDLEIISHDK